MKNCCPVNHCHCTCAYKPLIGRILLSLVFLITAISIMMNFHSIAEMMTQRGISAPRVILIITLLINLIGGLSVLLGWFTRVGAWILIIYTIIATLMIHHFWTMSGEEAMLNFNHFLKNWAIVGGLLLLVGYGPGKWSVDACCCNKYNDKYCRTHGTDVTGKNNCCTPNKDDRNNNINK